MPACGVSVCACDVCVCVCSVLPFKLFGTENCGFSLITETK